MDEQREQDRQRAIARYRHGENPSSISVSLGYSRDWFYRWLKRFESGDPYWYREASRRPAHVPSRMAPQTEEAVTLVRAQLDNRGEFSGAGVIRWELEELGVKPLPSIRTINRILARHGLKRRRHGPYVAKGKAYPKLVAHTPGTLHQTDFVGPRYLTGGQRFYGLNSIDVASGRCATEVTLSRNAQATVDAFWCSWWRLGIPTHQQVDNEMVFYGSQRHPRGMGPLIRLCLLQGVEVWFNPMREPWRNGVVEKFNDFWQEKFLGRTQLNSATELRSENLNFEQRHNSRYRYSKLNGKTPAEALKASGMKLRYPMNDNAPRHPLPKPEGGRYHLVRFVRSNGVVNVFGEQFKAPPEAMYEYVQLTVDVARQRLQVLLDHRLVDEHPYQMR